MRRAPIIAVSGHPGSGKSTLVAALRQRLGAVSFNYDDYETMTSRPTAEIRRWMEEGSDYDLIDLASLECALETAASADPLPPAVLFDSLLGRAHRRTGRLIDLALWIDTPADIALARKIADATHIARDKGEEISFANWLSAWLGHYQGFIADSYRTQDSRVRPLADQVLDGRLPPDMLAVAAATAIDAWMRNRS